MKPPESVTKETICWPSGLAASGIRGRAKGACAKKFDAWILDGQIPSTMTGETGLTAPLVRTFWVNSQEIVITSYSIHYTKLYDLFPKTLPGFEFGTITDLVNTTNTSDDIRLDETGKGVIKVDNQWKEVTSPHWVTANVSLYDSGERPVVRNASWQVWPAQSLVGIRNMSGTEDDPDQVPNNDTAKFEVILADTQGRLKAAQGLERNNFV